MIERFEKLTCDGCGRVSTYPLGETPPFGWVLINGAALAGSRLLPLRLLCQGCGVAIEETLRTRRDVPHG